MKKKTIKIAIPEPCNMVFEDMPIVNHERYCGKCEKQIIDFTLKSDRAIIDAYQKNNGKLCGRFSKDQLNRDIVLNPKLYANTRWKAFGLMLGGLLSAGALNGQNNPISSPIKFEESESRKDENGKEVKKNVVEDKKTTFTIIPDSNYVIITGIVTDIYHNPLQDIMVRTNTNYHAYTGKEGQYILKIPKDTINENLVLKYDSFAENTKEKIKVLQKESLGIHTLNINLEKGEPYHHSGILGVILIDDDKPKKKQIVQKDYKSKISSGSTETINILKYKIFIDLEWSLISIKSSVKRNVLLQLETSDKFIFNLSVPLKEGKNLIELPFDYMKEINDFKLNCLDINGHQISSFDLSRF